MMKTLFINNINMESTTWLHLMALSDSTIAFVQLQNLRCDAFDVSSQTFIAEAQNANFNTMHRVLLCRITQNWIWKPFFGEPIQLSHYDCSGVIKTRVINITNTVKPHSGLSPFLFASLGWAAATKLSSILGAQMHPSTTGWPSWPTLCQINTETIMGVDKTPAGLEDLDLTL